MHGDDVGHRLAQVVEDAAPLTDASDDGAEVVVGDDQRRRLAGHVGAAGTHGDTDVGCSQRRRVIHPVARHADDLAVRLQRTDEPQLLLGHHAGEHPDRADAVGQLLVVHRQQLGAGDAPAGVVEADLASDRQRRARVVAGDHHCAHTCPGTLGHRLGHTGAHRVVQARQPEELELEVVLLGGQLLPCIELGAGHGEHPLPVGRRRLHLGHQRRQSVGIEMAQVGDRLGCALSRHHEVGAVGRAPHVRQSEQVLRQRVLAHQLPVAVQVLGAGEGAVAQHPERLVHRVERIDRRGEHGELGDGVERLGQRFIAQHMRRPVDHQFAHRHRVQGERAGLVDADDRRGAERLDDRRPAGEHMPLRHPPGTQGQEHGEHHRELLGQHRHRGGDAGEETLEPTAA